MEKIKKVLILQIKDDIKDNLEEYNLKIDSNWLKLIGLNDLEEKREYPMISEEGFNNLLGRKLIGVDSKLNSANNMNHYLHAGTRTESTYYIFDEKYFWIFYLPKFMFNIVDEVEVDDITDVNRFFNEDKLRGITKLEASLQKEKEKLIDKVAILETENKKLEDKLLNLQKDTSQFTSDEIQNAQEEIFGNSEEKEGEEFGPVNLENEEPDELLWKDLRVEKLKKIIYNLIEMM